ncbi:Uncharacterised protein [Mycobacterium tuberculosis]|nr:Uncharacterised protein [Mycobacterium tuberculosis]
MPLTISGRLVSDRSHSKSSHLNGPPKIGNLRTAAAVASSPGCKLARNTGSEV